MESDTVYLFDVDNTLIDNDRVIDDLMRHLDATLGAEEARRYWSIFEAWRDECGYADYFGAMQRYRDQLPGARMNEPAVLHMAQFLLDYPFADRLYPDALRVIDDVRALGTVGILSDGDTVLQPLKVRRSGLWQAVVGNVLIFIHKEEMVAAIEQRFGARHYVLVDDKLRILTAMKTQLGDRLTTVFPRQGHYAHDTQAIAKLPPADIAVERIGELLGRQWSSGGQSPS